MSACSCGQMSQCLTFDPELANKKTESELKEGKGDLSTGMDVGKEP